MENDVNTNSATVEATGLESSPSQNQTSAEPSDLDENTFISDLSEDNHEQEKTQTETDEANSEAKDEEDAQEEYAKASDRKTELNEEIRELHRQTVLAKQELESVRNEVGNYKELRLPTAEELAHHLMSQDEELDEQTAFTEARLRLVEAERERSQYINQIAQTRQEVTEAAQLLKVEYPELFDSNSKDFNRELANQILDSYETFANVQRADDGEIVDTSAKMYPFMKLVAEAYKSGQNKGSKSSIAKARTKIANAMDPNPNASIKTSTEDPLFEGWDDDDY